MVIAALFKKTSLSITCLQRTSRRDGFSKDSAHRQIKVGT